MTPATARKPGPEAGKDILKAHNLTGAQMGVLRTAARKWRNSRNADQGPHDGQISHVNVHGSTLQILITRGLLVKENLYSEADRAKRTNDAATKIRKAFAVAMVHEPDDNMQMDGIDGDLIDTPAWKVVLELLEDAQDFQNGNLQKVIRITDAGRVIVAEFKAAIGAEEE